MYQYDISVVIPTYNVETFIIEALDSVVAQTFKGRVEILLIDDCSTDNTPHIIEEYKNQYAHLPIRILYQEENMRQGTARNRGIRESKGKYVFFLDSDDVLDPQTFEKMFDIAESNACDFVVCDWAYYYEDKGLVYVNNDKFMFTDFLEDEDCEQLLQATTYFTVNKLYSRDFLLNNQIVYGEGYIYEDYEFYVDVAQRANKIGIVQNPFYHVRVNEQSTTKSNRKSRMHIDSLIKAVNNTITKFEPRGKESYYHLYKYIIRKTMNYIRYRSPFGMKRDTIKKIVNILNSKKRDYYVPRRVVPLYYFYFRRKYVQNGNINKIILIDHLYSHGKLTPLVNRAKKVKNRLLANKTIYSLNKKRLASKRMKKVEQFKKQSLKNDVVLFLGFDYRYAGNSKYFYDYLISNNDRGISYYFVTKNKAIPSRYRVEPRTLNFYKILYQAKLVIAESWVPLDFTKKEGQSWIQLWHGTPFKKVFFDSHEKYISMFNINHKKHKQKDISKWDYLLADSVMGAEKLSSSFAYKPERILNYGYPRVQWLKENKNNEELKNEIKDRLGIDPTKKVILYVPTWRDYNYKVSKPDLSYLLNVEQVVDQLNDEYVFLYKEHSMDKFKVRKEGIISPNDQTETQELILISDLIISDYSSIIFDGMAIDKPFYLFINDFDKYKDARGVYEDMHDILKAMYVDNEEQLVHYIQTLDYSKPSKSYQAAKEIMSNVQHVNSCEMLQEKVYSILNDDEELSISESVSCKQHAS